MTNKQKPPSPDTENECSHESLVPNPVTVEAMREVRDLKNARFATVEELMADLNNDD